MLDCAQTAALLRSWDKILVMSHASPDGDTLGSASALLRGLVSLGKQVRFFCADPVPEKFQYLFAGIPLGDFAPDHVMTVDVADKRLLGEAPLEYLARVELAIDHHGSHGFFAPNVCLDADAAACGEIVCGIIRGLTAMTPEIAMLLYVAIATDTGCFVYTNTTAHTHRIAAELLETGIDVGPVNKALFRTKSRTRLAMEARMVADMTLYDHDRVVMMTIPLSLRQEMHATEADIEELSSLAALVEGSDCGVTLRELRPGVIKISLRTGPRVDASAVCQRLGGGGHRAAAGHSDGPGQLFVGEVARVHARVEAFAAHIHGVGSVFYRLVEQQTHFFGVCIALFHVDFRPLK